MKPQKLQKKLYLNKKTIADLSVGQLEKIMAGIEETVFPCEIPPTNRITFCTPTCNTCVSCETCGDTCVVTCVPNGCTIKGSCAPECHYTGTV